MPVPNLDHFATTSVVAGLDAATLTSLDQIATVARSIVTDGPATGCRAIDLRMYGGIDVRLLPDRGFDIGAAWFGGVPLAWMSPVGETAPRPGSRDEDWVEAFSGGLVTTCGLRNVGAPSEGLGQHGAFSHQRAEVLGVHRVVGDDGAVALRVSARIAERHALRWHLSVDRTITTHGGEGRIELHDVTTNNGRDPEPAPLLYHVNIGPPLWGAGARLSIDGHEEAVPRDRASAAAVATWDAAPDPVRAGDRVFEHRFTPAATGWGCARVTNERVGLQLTLAWDAGVLSRLHQWVNPTPGVYAFALEPANCSVLGRAADRAEGRLPVLAAGEARTTRLVIGVQHLGAR